MRLDVRHLEVLLAVEEAGSITGAARILGVDQPHVTRQLRRIEEWLGAAVFARTSRGVRATPAGERALILARQALDVIDDLAAVNVADRVGASTRFLRVLYYGVPAITALDDLTERFSDLEVRFGTARPREAVEELRSGAADVFLGVALPHVEWPRTGTLACVELLADPTLAYLSAEHPLATKEDLRLSDLAGEGWVAGVDQDSWTMVSQECRLVGGFTPRMSHSVDDEASLHALVSRGYGVALGSSVAAQRDGVVARPYQGASPARWLQVYPPGRVDRDVVATLADVLRARYASWVEALKNAPERSRP